MLDRDEQPTMLLAATGSGLACVTLGADEPLVETLLTGHDVRCLAVSAHGIWAGTQAGEVHRSTDGRTWSSAMLDAPVKALAARDDAVFAGTKEPRVHLSDDGGASWRPLARFSRARSWWWAQPAERPFRPTYVSALAVTESSIVAGIEGCSVVCSRDGGRTWSGHRDGALRDCHELVARGERVYEAGSGGFAISLDGGANWERRRVGLDRHYGWSLALGSNTVYLAVARYFSAHSGRSRALVYHSSEGGVWRRCTDELASLPRLAACGNAVFAALGDGSLLSSFDEGASWARLPDLLDGPCRALVLC